MATTPITKKVKGVLLTISHDLEPSTPEELASPMLSGLVLEGYCSSIFPADFANYTGWMSSRVSARIGAPLELLDIGAVATAKEADGTIKTTHQGIMPVNPAASCLLASTALDGDFGKPTKLMKGDVLVMREDREDLEPAQVVVLCEYIGAMVGAFKETVLRWALEGGEDGKDVDMESSLEGLATMFEKEEFGQWFDKIKKQRVERGDGDDWEDVENPAL